MNRSYTEGGARPALAAHSAFFLSLNWRCAAFISPEAG